MRALNLTAYNQLEIIEVEKPSIAEDEVLLRIEAVGICGSDVHGVDGSTGRRIPPIIMGHEAAGSIVEAGSRVASYSVGDRVTFDSTRYCGSCRFCRRGEVNFCENRRVFGVSCDEYTYQGAFAEYLAVPERLLYRLPDGLSFEAGAMIEPLSIAVHAVDITPISVGDKALVFGAGIIGLLTMLVLKQAGCGRVVMADINPKRLDFARTLGADLTVDTGSKDADAFLQQASDGLGFECAFDAVGLEPTLTGAIGQLRKGGTVTVIGNFAPEIRLPLQQVVSRQIRIQGSNASAGEYGACIELLRSGRIDVEPLISARADLAEGAHWFEELSRKDTELLKVILYPGVNR